MRRGPKPKPTSLKLIEGNPGKRKLPENEPKPKPIAPDCPSWINADGKRMWKKLAPELERMGLLTIVDGEAFAAACHNYGLWLECERYFKKKVKDTETGESHTIGRTYLYTNKNDSENEIERPQVKIGQRALADFRSFCSEFGLTPASRTRIEVKPPGEALDPMEQLLRGNGG